ncbi:MAG: hypothetical protein GKS06_13435 [Acidobacteria bacterium]|nr:hypothetical protein [Acidobacteriota bacterium]
MTRPHRTYLALLAGAALLISPAAHGLPAAELGSEQRLLVREALQIVGIVGDQIWPGWGTTPKTTLVVGQEHEFLVALGRRVDVPEDFQDTGERIAGFRVFSRERTLPITLRAAFEVDGVPMAVVGAWDPTEESPNEWAISLVQQWFHLLQLQRGVGLRVDALGGEVATRTTWPADYAFPFDDEDVGNAMVLLGGALYDFDAIAADLPRDSQRSFQAETTRAALQNLRTVLELKYGPDAYAFFRLRTWRDGVARYSGVLVSRLLAIAENRRQYESMDGFDRLEEHKTYQDVWRDGYANQIWLIRTAQFDSERHLTSFNALGHGMAVMLDVVLPDWKKRYFESDIWLDDLIADGLDSLSETPRASARR